MQLKLYINVKQKNKKKSLKADESHSLSDLSFILVELKWNKNNYKQIQLIVRPNNLNSIHNLVSFSFIYMELIIIKTG